MSLKTLAAKVQKLQKKLQLLQMEQSTICGNPVRYKELGEVLIPAMTNEVFDAVNDFNAAIQEQIGVTPNQLAVLTRHNGYVCGKNIKRPRTLIL
ncbi:hypothetical protein CCP3SC15_730017 [Gammaproteobacteria bacterium]